MVMKVVAGLIMILAINHLIACCWFGIGTVELDGKSWIIQSQLETADFAEAYAASIHWAVSLAVDSRSGREKEEEEETGREEEEEADEEET